MTVELVNQAYKVKNLSSSEKAVLVRLAWHADPEAYPSIKSLSEDTSLDRKTVQKVLLDLAQKKLIIDTGKRKGRTKLIKVFLINLNDPKNGTVQKLNDPNFSCNDPKNGIVKRSQNWDMERSVIKDHRKEENFKNSQGPKAIKDLLVKLGTKTPKTS